MFHSYNYRYNHVNVITEIEFDFYLLLMLILYCLKRHIHFRELILNKAYRATEGGQLFSSYVFVINPI